jgi:hypothetical protein
MQMDRVMGALCRCGHEEHAAGLPDEIEWINSEVAAIVRGAVSASAPDPYPQPPPAADPAYVTGEAKYQKWTKTIKTAL